MPERLQKILARHGIGSRREIERWISEGRVTINLKPAELGAQYLPGDRVAVDGKELTARLSIEVAPKVLLFHKSQGQPITHDLRSKRPPMEGGDSTDSSAVEPGGVVDDGDAVIDKLPAIRGSRWVPINPMHAGDSGLLLLTNDGNLSYALTRKKRWIPCHYMVRVLAPSDANDEVRVPPEIPPRVNYDSGKGNETVEFALVEPAGGEGSNLWYRVESDRADHRAAVRALFESRDLKVSRMTQVSFGPIDLPRDLPRGRHRELTDVQVAALYELAQIPLPTPTEPRPTRPLHGKRMSVAPDRRRKPKPAPTSKPKTEPQTFKTNTKPKPKLKFGSRKRR